MYLRLSIPTLDMKFDVVINDRGMAAASFNLNALSHALPFCTLGSTDAGYAGADQ